MLCPCEFTLAQGRLGVVSSCTRPFRSIPVSLHGCRSVGIADIESLGNGHRTALVTGTSCDGNCQHHAETIRQERMECQCETVEAARARADVKYVGILPA